MPKLPMPGTRTRPANTATMPIATYQRPSHGTRRRISVPIAEGVADALGVTGQKLPRLAQARRASKHKPRVTCARTKLAGHYRCASADRHGHRAHDGARPLAPDHPGEALSKPARA